MRQRLGKLETKAEAAKVPTCAGLVFLYPGDPDGDYPDGTCVIRFVEPDAGEVRMPHNGREPWPAGNL